MDKEDLLSMFLSAHILKKPGKQDYIIYNWNIKYMSYCFNDSVAADWYRSHKDILINETIHFDIFWAKSKYDLLYWDSDIEVKSSQDLTEEFKSLLHVYLKNWVISDQRYKVFSSILERFWVYLMNDKYISYVPLNPDDIICVDKTVEVEVWDISYTTEINGDIEITQYEQALLLIKEVANWYYDVRPHSMCDQVWKTMKQQNYKIWQDVTINIKQWELISVSMKSTEYSAKKEQWVYYVITPTWEEIRADKFNPVISTNNEDWTSTILLVWAYTHLLRKALEFNPLTWQYRFLMNMLRLNYVAWTRRSGKTKLSSYLIVRELWRMPITPQQSQRPIKTLYLAPTEDKLEEVMDYIKTSTEKIRLLKVIRVLEWKKKRVILSDEEPWRNGKVYKEIWVCMLSSARWYEPGRWKASDFIMIDEAWFIHEDIYLNILPILENERAKLYCISTIDWNTPRQWFYENLVDTERWLDSESFAMRVTIDDIDDWLISASSKERMKKALQNNSQRYYAELYATFPSMDSVFSTEWFFIPMESAETPEMAIIAYDPAKRHDMSAVVIWHVYKNKVELVKEYNLQWDYSTSQKDRIMQLKQSYINQWIQVVVIMDWTWVWTWVAEILWWLVDFKTWYTWSIKKPEIDRFWFWKVSKEILVSITRILMESNKLKCYLWLDLLMTQLKSFKRMETNAWNFKYEADWWYDDHVNAMMLIAFCYWIIYWNVYDIYKDITKDYIDWIKEIEWWLYKTRSYRSTWNSDNVSKLYWFGI